MKALTRGSAGDDAGLADSRPLSPDDAVGALSKRQVEMLRVVGAQWAAGTDTRLDPLRGLPVDPSLDSRPAPARIRRTRLVSFVRVQEPRGSALEATGESALPATRARTLALVLRRTLVGPPLRSTAIALERMRKLVALPVLSADALSSVAYGPEAMLAVLVLAGAAGRDYTIPIAAAIATLMLAVGVSYRQTIRAYPHGGGSYIVASDNLGRLPGLFAAAGLMTDYILTVSVSVAAGVEAVSSSIPSLAGDRVPIGVLVIVVLLAGNLRGVRQAGALFAAPTYVFIAIVALLVVVGVADPAEHGLRVAPQPPVLATEGVGLLLILRAFASGATAMTGIEAISNAVPAFRAVEWRNARTTLTWMVGLLIALFAGTVALVHLDGVVPDARQTVLSQLAHLSFGGGPLYAVAQAATAAILMLAANTAYNDFPRVLFLLARDHQAPRLFLRLGDRLSFSNGIILLSLAATAIYVGFDADTARLIPLYAVGVFLAFTLSQSGMVVHWWRLRDPRWRRSLAFNALGAALSAAVFVTAAVTKFTSGAWVSLLTVGLLVALASLIRRHYQAASLASELTSGAAHASGHPGAPPTSAVSIERAAGAEDDESAAARHGEREVTPAQVRSLALVPVATLDQPSMRALAYAASLRQPLLALHVSPSDAEAERFRSYWQAWGDHVPLEIVVSPYRAVVAPLIDYAESLHRLHRDLTLTVVLPEIVVRHRWQRLLHNHTAQRLRRGLQPLSNVVVTTVPFHLPP